MAQRVPQAVLNCLWSNIIKSMLMSIKSSTPMAAAGLSRACKWLYDYPGVAS